MASAVSTVDCWPAGVFNSDCARSSVSSALRCCASSCCYGRLVGVDLGLKRRLLEQIEQIALLDLGALDKQPLFEKRGDPGDERHPAHRLDAADELVGLGDLLALGAHHADRRRPARRRLRPRLNRQQGERKSEQEA